MNFHRFFGMSKRNKRYRLKNFQDLYDLAMKHLTEGQRQVLLGEFLLEITQPKSPEDDIDICIRRDDSDEVRRCREEGRIMRRRFLPPDEIRLAVRTKSKYANRKIIEVNITSEEDGKIHICVFLLSAPLKGLKEAFPNNVYVSTIVDSLLSYDGE